MIFGLFAKAWRETRGVVGVLGLGMFILVLLFAHVLPRLYGSINLLIAQVPLVKVMVAASLGTDTEFTFTLRTMLGLLWAHPLVMTLVWTVDIVLCTRFPVGEIDRGTIDVLLGWPVSRFAIFMVETAMWLLAGGFVIGCGFLGWMTARQLESLWDLPGMGDTMLVCVNLFFVHLAVGGFAFLVSSLSDRRASATGVVFGAVVVSYLINVLAPFWPPAANLRFASVLEYYQPGAVLVSRSLDGRHLLWLGGFALLTWTTAAWQVGRRNITTV